MSNEIATITTNGQEFSLSVDDVMKSLCTTATRAEAIKFVSFCRVYNLNPFIKEIYLIKYNGHPAHYTVSKDLFIKRAEAMPSYKGFKAGIAVISDKGDLIYREGSLLLPKDTLVGGWAEVYINGRDVAQRAEVALSEYDQGTSLWKSKKATMIRKVAVVQAFREAFENAFGGLYEEVEIEGMEKKISKTLKYADTVEEDNIIDACAEQVEGVLFTNVEDSESSDIKENLEEKSENTKSLEETSDKELSSITYVFQKGPYTGLLLRDCTDIGYLKEGLLRVKDEDTCAQIKFMITYLEEKCK